MVKFSNPKDILTPFSTLGPPLSAVLFRHPDLSPPLPYPIGLGSFPNTAHSLIDRLFMNFPPAAFSPTNAPPEAFPFCRTLVQEETPHACSWISWSCSKRFMPICACPTPLFLRHFFFKFYFYSLIGFHRYSISYLFLIRWLQPITSTEIPPVRPSAYNEASVLSTFRLCRPDLYSFSTRHIFSLHISIERFKTPFYLRIAIVVFLLHPPFIALPPLTPLYFLTLAIPPSYADH